MKVTIELVGNVEGTPTLVASHLLRLADIVRSGPYSDDVYRTVTEGTDFAGLPFKWTITRTLWPTSQPKPPTAHDTTHATLDTHQAPKAP